MAKMLIVYYSRSGNTEKMAQAVKEGAADVEGVEVELKKVADTTPDDLLEADGIIIGSPTYYGTMASEVKKLIDSSVKYHGKLNGNVGGAFASSGVMGGGLETTVMDILKCMLVHGMIIQGNSQGAHYGPVSVGAPNLEVTKACRAYGQSVAELTLKLCG
ncbi:MAG TPA: NAD(P)H-dependent oxidoreductase [Planctomycetota bacterium]|nr:NAD(P)H-dependent oxidoreductase [Planctomycetota bacterium]